MVWRAEFVVGVAVPRGGGEWELTGSCRCQGFSYRTFDKERGTTCEPRSQSTRSTLITQRQSENHQLILKTGLATLGRLPIDQYDRERRGEEVGGDAGLRGRREETLILEKDKLACTE